MKNIPIPSKQQYLKQLISKIESFVRRLRWKAFFFDYKEQAEQESQINRYNFKSEKCPPQHSALTPFENELYDLAKDIKFRKVTNEFQNQLTQDIKKINLSVSFPPVISLICCTGFVVALFTRE